MNMKKYLLIGFIALGFGCSGKLLATAASARMVNETARLELLSAVMNRYVGFVNLTEVTRAAGQDLPTFAAALFAEDCVKVVNGAEKARSCRQITDQMVKMGTDLPGGWFVYPRNFVFGKNCAGNDTGVMVLDFTLGGKPFMIMVQLIFNDAGKICQIEEVFAPVDVVAAT